MRRLVSHESGAQVEQLLFAQCICRVLVSLAYGSPYIGLFAFRLGLKHGKAFIGELDDMLWNLAVARLPGDYFLCHE